MRYLLNLNKSKYETFANNKYDYLLIFFLTLQIFGTIGDSMQPIRIFVLICLPFTFFFFLSNIKEISRYQYEITLFIFWILYSTITIIWIINPIAGLKEIFYLIVNFSGILSFFYFAIKANNPLLSIIKGWVYLFLISAPIAIYELIYDVHLPMSFQESGSLIGGIGILRRFASVTFGNYNGYNVIIVYTIPFILSLLFIYKNIFKSIMIWALLLVAFFILALNASRGSLVCSLISIITFFYFSKKNKTNLMGILVFITIALITIIYYYDEVFFLISRRITGLGLDDNLRSDIITKGFQLLKKYYFFGVGAGNFQPLMSKYYHLEILAPHNFFLEVMVQYGLIIFIFFLGLFIKILIFTRKNHSPIARYIVISSLLSFPFSSVINSGYINGLPVWLLIASLYVIADKKYSNIKL